jgi:hypothetical protein
MSTEKSTGLWRFLFGELSIAVGSSERVLGSMKVADGVATPYRGLVPGAARLDPADVARVVGVRRKIAAVYATLGLVLPMFIVVRIAMVAWSGMNVADPVSVAVTVCVTLVMMLVFGGGLAVGGLFVARPIVERILKREERRARTAD